MSSRENANDTNQVVIVDLSDANNVIRRPSKSPPLFDSWRELMIVTADSAIMHPKEKIIALKCKLDLSR
jgi:clathrin heavy chain